jgi:hypothetical protein
LRGGVGDSDPGGDGGGDAFCGDGALSKRSHSDPAAAVCLAHFPPSLFRFSLLICSFALCVAPCARLHPSLFSFFVPPVPCARTRNHARREVRARWTTLLSCARCGSRQRTTYGCRATLSWSHCSQVCRYFVGAHAPPFFLFLSRALSRPDRCLIRPPQSRTVQQCTRGERRSCRVRSRRCDRRRCTGAATQHAARYGCPRRRRRRRRASARARCCLCRCWTTPTSRQSHPLRTQTTRLAGAKGLASQARPPLPLPLLLIRHHRRCCHRARQLL